MRKLFAVVFLAALAAFAPSPASAQCQWNRWWMPQVHRGYGYGGYYGGYPRWYSTGYGYGGYYNGYGEGYQCSTGVKFHLDLVAKSDLKQVKQAIVSVDGNEFGIVNRFDSFWNGVLPLPPGQHELALEMADGRKFRTVVALSFGTVVSVYPRFRAEGNGETVAEPTSAPAPAPSAAPPQTVPVKPEVAPAPAKPAPNAESSATQLAAERENPRCQGPWPVPEWFHRATAGCR